MFAVILLSLVAVAASWWWIKKEVNAQVEHGPADKVISIEQGTGTQAIINRLSEAGIVQSPTLLKIYLYVTGRSGRLKAGDYRFQSPISALEAIEKIERGEVTFERVTIPEGFTRFEIADRLAEETRKATAKEFLRLMSDPSLAARIDPKARNLEGYLFPDTYNYTSSTTPEELIRAMVNRFNEVFTAEWKSRAAQLGMSVHQAVTLASLIEEEARVMDERPKVASVFMNRLKIDMPLASDPTFIYAAMLENDYDGNPNNPRHRRRDSLYNTYLYSGLPPGPIASPGRASLEAALYPAHTDYLYFVVSGTEGRHKFSRTAAEHEAAVNQYRQQQRRQANR
ncbi:MAG: endolytic transglycosylase MltG [Acidobacteriota bacterium]